MTDVREPAAGASDLALSVISLCKGAVYRESNEHVWETVLRLRPPISDHVAVLGLQLVIDESEGYAYLRSQPAIDDRQELPRLVARRTLSFHVSILLALLRKRLAESDATDANTRLILTRDQMVEMLRMFLPASTNDARLVDLIDAHIAKVVELGFLRRLRTEPNRYEVRRILKAYVDGQWLGAFDERLSQYLAELDASEEDA